MSEPTFMGLSELTHKVSAADLEALEDCVVVMHRNRPIAALVPMALYLEWQSVLRWADAQKGSPS